MPNGIAPRSSDPFREAFSYIARTRYKAAMHCLHPLPDQPESPTSAGPGVFPQDSVNCVNFVSFLLRKMNETAKGAA